MQDWHEFSAPNPMKGTSFDINDDEDDIETIDIYNRGIDLRPLNEIKQMIEDILQRMSYYERRYKQAKKSGDRGTQISALRNYKALEGARQALRWAIQEQGVEHPLY
mgnify:FL=1